MKLLKLPIAMAAFAVLSLSASSAMSKPKVPEPDGIQAGGFVMHPGASLALAYDTKGNQGPADGFADIGAYFKTRMADETQYAWNNKFDLKWRQFWGIGDADPNGGINVQLSTAADLFKQGVFRVSPSASYQYITDPEDENLRQDYKNHTVRAGVGLSIQPGQGAIFVEKLSYNMSGRLYSDFSDISHFSHRIESMTRWNFLPNSSMSLTANVTITHFLEDTRKSSSNGQGVVVAGENSTSYPFRISYGLQGLLLSRLSYQLGFGYAYVYYTNENKEHLYIMRARLGYSFRDNIELALEYQKDFDNSTFGDYYKYHRVALSFDAMWFDHLQTNFELGYGYFDFKSLLDMTRDDNMLTAKADVYYHFFPGFKLGLEYRLNYNSSNLAGADYAKHLVMLNLAYEY